MGGSKGRASWAKQEGGGSSNTNGATSSMRTNTSKPKQRQVRDHDWPDKVGPCNL